MLPTPSTSHVNYNRIYEPAEDSFLLLDTLSSQSESDFLHTRFPPEDTTPLLIEVGVGSGVVLAFVTAHANQIFGRSDVATLGTDVNSFACIASRQTINAATSELKNRPDEPASFLASLNCDLATALKPGSVDVLIFNPPYVPSEHLPSILPELQMEVEQNSTSLLSHDVHLLALSTDGGVDGMETTNRLLADLDSVLSARGLAYILLCAQNKPDEIMTRIRAWSTTNRNTRVNKWLVENISSSGNKAGWERLCVIRVWRETTFS